MPHAAGRAVLAALALMTLVTANTISAQDGARTSSPDYPTKPVRMIVPLAPGGGSDIVGRIVALALTDHWGQPVVVDNRPGAGSTVGTSIAAKAPADGYTLLVSSSSIAISPALYKNLNFDIKRDFDEVTLIASQPSILVVHPAVPVNSVRDLIALARSQPGKLNFASAGAGSATHLGTELLQHAAGISMLHVPYKSAGLAASALLSGEVQVLLTNMASTLPYVKSGKIRALGVSSLERSPLVPGLPTIAEAGVPGFEYVTWYGMLVPKGTPRAVIVRIQTDTAKIISNAQVQERFAKLGLTAYGTTPADFGIYLNAEIAKWDKLVRMAGVRAQ
ncbi:MAG: Bug family tripartite tricarboxylate transporter substrate binding protein [Burkholderiales bacterium]